MTQTQEEALASQAVKYVPWAPSWEEGIEIHSGLRSNASLATLAQRNFTDTERELLHRGVELMVGVKEAQVMDRPDIISQIIDPASTHSTSHFLVAHNPGPVDILTIQKEGDATILLEAERIKDPSSKLIWKITSPLGEIGNCGVYTPDKHMSFYLLRDGFEEAAIYYRKASGNTNLRCFDVVVPSLQRDTGKHVPIRFDDKSSYLLAQAPLQTVPNDCIKMSVREPQQKDGRWVLMFNGRVKRTSARNFILVHPAQPSREILLCGKCGVKQFVFDLNWPLSLIQGFGIYLTLFSKPKPH
ncbi:hypothetical protein TRFO_39855 [Tritrichomonas foetus]|uniref:Tubby C-terminal domain-containing protein n=1 Tax=Tritrichomonas foetus TaxID=1144522 RepID=A0A1J4J9N7_9EUKA|nr:hypothetical protein TRFO_39855 [Tritrichomonas foetus]|eukprot:OHS93956.1 hypothetical protein TRFO_39855 [Tritrichomonas foetus]